MPPANKRRNLQDPQQILEVLERFLVAATNPVLIESGRPPITVDGDRLAMTPSSNGLTLEVWGPEGSLIRRITSITSESRHRVVAQAKRFGAAAVQLMLVDQAARPTVGSVIGHSSEAFLQRLLAREFPDGRVSRLSGASDLQHSLSGRHVRCLLQARNVSWAVTAAPPLSSVDACNCALTAGLLWLQRLRDTCRGQPVVGLRLLLPLGHEAKTARLLQFLDPARAAYEVFSYDASGTSRRVDLSNSGNQESGLHAYRSAVAPGPPIDDWIETLEALGHVERVVQADGVQSLRVNGLEFATIRGRQMEFGLDVRTAVTESNFNGVMLLAQELGSFRNAQAPARDHPLYRATPERWLESQLRRHIRTVDRTLGSHPIYSQAVSSRGVDRGVIDLLTLDQTGRLVVIEVKATANLQLPIQALDYWSQLVFENQQNAESIQSLFPAQPISSEVPRLLLVAPALEFHSTSDTIIRFVSTIVPVERIGVSNDWRLRLRKHFILRSPQTSRSTIYQR
jgi:hypothetical protein